jgi:hypothetical protein
MTRTRITQVGLGAWAGAVALALLAAEPAQAGDVAIGGFVSTGGYGGTSIGGFVRIGEGHPRVARRPVAVVRAPAPRVVCRDVPVVDRFGRVIEYRRECTPVRPPVARRTVVRRPVAAWPARVETRGPVGGRYQAPPRGALPRTGAGLGNRIPVRGGRGLPANGNALGNLINSGQLGRILGR